MQYKIGDKSGYLKITGIETNKEKFRRPRTELICTCLKCGRENYKILPYNLKKQKSCGCDRTWRAPPSGANSKLYKGFKTMPSRFIYKAKERATRKKIAFDLTQEFLWNLFESQNGKCNISGLSLSFGASSKDSNATASLDRIDSTKGYTQDNVQWLHKDINLMKNVFKEEYFIQLCRMVTSQNDFPKVNPQNL